MEDLISHSLLPACKLLCCIKKHFLKSNQNICALRRGGKNIFKALKKNSEASLWY